MFNYQILKEAVGDSEDNLSELARLSKVSHTTISRIINGKANPKIGTLMQLAAALKTTVGELIGEKPKGGIQTITVDTTGEELITTIPYKARAGYIIGHNDPEYIEDLPISILPEKKFKSTTTRCFEISGDSMEPTLRDRDYIYATQVQRESWEDLKENRVHVLITVDGIVIKRVLNIKEGGYFFCLSDNPNTTPFRVFYKDIIEIWEARRRMTADFGRKADPKSAPYSDEFELTESEK